jgi:hypothetical protein
MNKQKLIVTLLFSSLSAATYAHCPFLEMREAHHQMMVEFEQRSAELDRLFSGCIGHSGAQHIEQGEKTGAQKLACPTTEIREEKEHMVVKCFLGENVETTETQNIQATMDDQGIEVTVPSLGKTVHISADKWDGVTYLTIRVIEERNEKSDEKEQKFFNRSRQRIMVASSLDLENPTIHVEDGFLTITIPKKMSKKVNFSLKQEAQDTKE